MAVQLDELVLQYLLGSSVVEVLESIFGLL
jgi:hypothetical protein